MTYPVLHKKNWLQKVREMAKGIADGLGVIGRKQISGFGSGSRIEEHRSSSSSSSSGRVIARGRPGFYLHGRVGH